MSVFIIQTTFFFNDVSVGQKVCIVFSKSVCIFIIAHDLELNASESLFLILIFLFFLSF